VRTSDTGNVSAFKRFLKSRKVNKNVKNFTMMIEGKVDSQNFRDFG
jgi:hypothetical protein